MGISSEEGRVQQLSEERPDRHTGPCSVSTEKHHAGCGFKQPRWDEEPRAVLVPAVLLGKPVEGDTSASTGTPEKPLDAIMPVVVMLLADAGV